MSAFATALAILHSDANMGTGGVYTRSPGAGIAVRVLLASPTDQLPSFGPIAARAGSISADVLASELGSIVPRRGDTLAIGGTTYKVDDTQRDSLGLSWHLTLTS